MDAMIWEKRTHGCNVSYKKFTNSGLISPNSEGLHRAILNKLTSSVFGDVEVNGVVVMIVR